MAIDYKQAGVDIAVGDQLVDWLKRQPTEGTPHQERLVSGIGGFAALFDARFPSYQHPLLVTSTDGVGTKLKLAIEFQKYQEVAQDLVAMSVNDLICCGAQPLFFLDYYATGKLELTAAKSFLQGVRQACNESGCLLIGGETAEMPGMYTGKDFDCAGFAVGVVDKAQVLGSHRVEVGQKIVGVASSGFHSNGYSLVRKLFANDLAQYIDELLQPTVLYAKLAQDLVKAEVVSAIAHITGGGMDNLTRVLPDQTQAHLNPWTFSPLFAEAQKRSQLDTLQMLKTFNCGVGLAVITDSYLDVLKICEKLGHKAFCMGEIQIGEGKPRWIWGGPDGVGSQ